MVNNAGRRRRRVPAVKEVVAALNRIDWSFPQSGSPPDSVHALHWFPGNFIPQIPSFLIQILSNPDDLVLDAFVGSGTTAVEAAILGRRAIAADRVTVCVSLTMAKLTTLRSPVGRQFTSELLAAMFPWDELCVSDAFGSKGEGSDPRLVDWYAPRTLQHLRYLWSLIEESPKSMRPIFLMLFSDVLFACASTAGSVTTSGKLRKHHWGWVADNVAPKRLSEHNAIKMFRDRLLSLSRFRPMDTGRSQVNVIQQDARQMALASASVDLVITSPPYIGVIDYTRANRLLYLWMGWPFDEDRRQEIGARYKRGRMRFVEEYQCDINACWQEIHRVLKPGGYCALVIGESRRFKGTVNHLLDNLKRLMPIVWGPVARLPQRRRVSDRLANQPVEHVCVFHKN